MTYYTCFECIVTYICHHPAETLPEFIAHHTVEKLCLPCKLVLPKSSSGGGGAPQVRRKPALMKQALQTGAGEKSTIMVRY